MDARHVLAAGADGCRAGWVRVTRDGPGLAAELVPRAAGLFAPELLVVGIDCPIGLPERGRRACENEARALLGRPRSSSVFPAPLRAAVSARTRAEADARTRRRDGRGVPAQAFGIYAKVHELDRALRAAPERARRAVEVHPELAFRALNEGRAVASSKKTEAGARTRRRLLAAAFGRGVVPALVRALRARGVRRSSVADDDVLDACAVLWSAERFLRGEARSLPQHPPRDRVGLPMRIVF